METQIMRRHRTIQINDQENQVRGKTDLAVPTKRQGLTVRGALGELNINVNAQREVNIGKVAVTAAEFEKKATLNKGVLRSNYSHVQSKIDTGLAAKTIQPSSRPPLRREESTAGLAARAVARSRTTVKDSKTAELKESIDALLQAKKAQKIKKPSSAKLPSLKETTKDSLIKPPQAKPILKDSTESLGRLKLSDSQPVQTNIIDLNKLDAIEDTPVLPEDIEDIDAKDNNSPLLMSVYIKDIYNYLTELEVKYAIQPNHLKKQSVITGNMRATLIDWLVEVQRQFCLILETFHLTIGIIDRYLQAVPNVQRNQLQLVGVTAMFIASKYEEVYPPSPADFVYVTDNAYTLQDMFRCERAIMTKLEFCLARPIPLSFLRRFVKAAHGTSKMHHLAKYFVDLCLIEYSMAHYRPSELSAAAICLSIHLLTGKSLDQVWTPTLQYYSGYPLSHIDPIFRKIAKIVLNVENSKFKAVQSKYSDAALAKVSRLAELRGDAVYELAKMPSPHDQ